MGIDKTKIHIIYDQIELQISPTDRVYITGDSRSGKSVLLHHLEKLLHQQTVNISDIRIDSSKPIIDTISKTVEEGLKR